MTLRRGGRKPNGIRSGDLVGGVRRPPAATAASALASSLRRRIVSPSSLSLSYVRRSSSRTVCRVHHPTTVSQSGARRRPREERKSPRCNRLPCRTRVRADSAAETRARLGPRRARSTYIQFTENAFLYPLLFFDSYFFVSYRPCFSAFHPAAHRAHGLSLNTRRANPVNGILLQTANDKLSGVKAATDHASPRIRVLLSDLIGPIEVLSSYRSHIGVAIQRCYEKTVLAGFRPIICRIGRFPGSCIVPQLVSQLFYLVILVVYN